jgi:hypothetical protein
MEGVDGEQNASGERETRTEQIGAGQGRRGTKEEVRGLATAAGGRAENDAVGADEGRNRRC